MKTKICVIGGHGYVGRSVHKLFDRHPDFISVIRDKGLTSEHGAVSDIAIVCVPTPMKEDGSCDTSIVEEVIEQSDFPLYLIKSAVPPGTTEYLSNQYNKKICVSPEYIGEGRYPIPWWEGKPHPTDMLKHEFQIFGGNKEDTDELVKVFSKVLGPYCRYIQTDAKTAELVKYMENSFFAAKVTFCHEFFRIAKAFGINYSELRELWLLDKRIDRGSTAVFKGQLGYSGKCLPKDISAIYQAAQKAGYSSDFLKQIMETNAEQREIYG